MILKGYQSKNPKYAGHTAGPWESRLTQYYGVPDDHQCVTVGTKDESICQMTGSKGAENQVLAMRDARLIADAPFLACEVERLRELCGELVGALEEIVNNAVKNYQGSMDIYPEAISVARSALAKAKGGDE